MDLTRSPINPWRAPLCFYLPWNNQFVDGPYQASFGIHPTCFKMWLQLKWLKNSVDLTPLYLLLVSFVWLVSPFWRSSWLLFLLCLGACGSFDLSALLQGVSFARLGCSCWGSPCSQLSSLRPVSPTLEVSSDASCNFIFIITHHVSGCEFRQGFF